MPADMHEYTSVYVALVQNVSSAKAQNSGVGPSHASCDMRPFASTKVREQVNSTWRSARALTYALEATVERLSSQDEHGNTGRA